jgi:hypothetical protein
MLDVATHGSLAVAWSTQDKDTIDRELRKLSPTLFLDPELSPEHGVYWTVKEHIGSGHPPVRALSGVKATGSRSRSRSGSSSRSSGRKAVPPTAAREAIDHNQRRIEKLREDADETYGDIKREHVKRIQAVADRTLPAFWRPKHFGRK